MGFIEDSELNQDKSRIRNLTNRFDEVVIQSNVYIDTVVNNRYGDLAKNITLVNTLKTSLEELKLKYPEAATEIDSRITQVNLDIDALKARWDLEVYNKLGA